MLLEVEINRAKLKFNLNNMITILLVASGILCFALFYKTVNFFENI